MNINDLYTNIQERAARLKLDPTLSAIIFFNIGGSEPAQWQGKVEDGQAVLTEGTPEKPDITVSATSEVAIGLFEKRINPMAAFMTGKVKVQGDKSKIGLIKSLILGQKAAK